ncbi:MAG: 3-oxoacyl-ACP reductase FabG [Firmicutes bacterium]|nr:3-oxoacyl-ACP reductase FabG [Bacillota bacterium]
MEKRTALVTGSSRGIGRAVAVELAKKGFDIVVNYRINKAEAEKTAAFVCDLGRRAIIVQADIRDAKQVDNLYKEAKAAFGFVDTLVNNAGISSCKLLIDCDEDEIEAVLGTNIKGALLVTKKFLPDMLSRRFGRIVNISSLWGIVGGAMESVYSASKAALIGLTKALSKEVLPSGVTVNAVAPGAVDTDMLRVFDQSVLDSIVGATMAGRLGQPLDVARAVCYFVDKNTGFISGQALTVSGEFIG